MATHSNEHARRICPPRMLPLNSQENITCETVVYSTSGGGFRVLRLQEAGDSSFQSSVLEKLNTVARQVGQMPDFTRLA